ncbi:uncharacterized protein LOC100373366 [Saccoglossus kowalevskii]|uniref:Uncharacterized threonine-rich GPI-anchored glycoprotein PJ4664.02-like n=1 Tax=Saccoglossus kowalevskii TaxID=10224 RepID=A0ABM0GS42_SACKO|nr:PREDICTED: uncharacterized threonine-rich GPI-anchored glycoprotein PJ4664.02-like [Saccoglossus kowalevskii]
MQEHILAVVLSTIISSTWVASTTLAATTSYVDSTTPQQNSLPAGTVDYGNNGNEYNSTYPQDNDVSGNDTTVTMKSVTTNYTGVNNITTPFPGTNMRQYVNESHTTNTTLITPEFILNQTATDEQITMKGNMNNTVTGSSAVTSSVTTQPSPGTTPNAALLTPSAHSQTAPNNITTIAPTSSVLTTVATTTLTTKQTTLQEKIKTTTSAVTSAAASNEINKTIDVQHIFVPGSGWTGVYIYDNQEVPFHMGFISNHNNQILTARINDGKAIISMSGEYSSTSHTLIFSVDDIILSRYDMPRFDKDTWSMIGVISVVTYPMYLYSGHMTGHGFGNFHMQLDLGSQKVSDGLNATPVPASHRHDLPVSMYIVLGVLVPLVVVACIIAGVYFYRTKKQGSFHLQTSLLSFSNPLYDGEPNSGLSTGPL